MPIRVAQIAGIVMVIAGEVCSASRGATVDPRAPLGQPVSTFELPDIHGKTHSLDEHQDQVVVLAFLGTECPLAKLYTHRLRDLATEFASQGVAFLGIDANQQDSLTEMAAFARVSALNFPLLRDNNNELADRLGAERTPEVFVLDRQRVIRYWGRIDDQYGLKTGGGYAKPKLTEDDLGDALRQVLAGQDVSRPTVKAHGCLIGRVTKTAPHGEVTYTKHIARILQDRCVNCHRPNEVAPFALTSYDEVLGWAATIREVVDEGRMPPWFADPRFGHFANDARLRDEEKKLISTWVDNGCPHGEPQDLPTPRQFADGWQMGQPDQVIYMSEEPFVLPADGTLKYQYFTVDPGWNTDKWIQVSEPRPGNRAVVHHINVHVKSENATDVIPPEGIGTYGPGFPPMICPPGTAIHVPAYSKIEFQVHYTPGGGEQQDRSMIGVRFADPRTVKKIVRQPCVEEKTFKIPPEVPYYEVRGSVTFSKDSLLLSLLPHMHLRGKTFRYEAEYPDGTTEVLLDVPNFNFNWQLRYIFNEPKLMPKGTKMRCIAHFDNSSDNLANPDPKRAVTWGEQTWDEMLQGAYYVVDAGPDVACIALVALSLTSDVKEAGTTSTRAE
jgi:peroxiredoxin/mono/diheme cytochrome c family protein